MALITDSNLVDVSLALLIFLYLIYCYYTNNDDYWVKRGVPMLKGNFIDMILGTKSQAEIMRETYSQLSGSRFGGLVQFRRPALIVKDPDLIHRILVKDFSHFEDRDNIPINEKNQFQSSLLGLQGKVWRALRHKLTPTFSTGKLRGMFEQISKCGDNMTEKIEELTEENAEVESKSFVFEFTVDVIASCAFGVQFKPNSPEFNQFKTYVTNMFLFSPLVILKFIIMFMFPKLATKIGIQPFTSGSSDYFTNLTKATMKSRKENNIKRNDYFQLLLTLKEQEESGKDMGVTSSDTTEDDEVINQMQYAVQDHQSLRNKKLMTEDVIIANTFIFLTAGSESTASTISFTLMNLANHPEIQRRLQAEVDNALEHHGDWSYDTIKHMNYLDQVIQETQRMYPTIPGLQRICVKPYKIPDSDIVIEKGTTIMIPVAGLHYDPQYYGPRICIAMRFAVMEVKTCVARIMSQYSVKMSPKTQLPLKFNKRALLPTVEGGIWLSFKKRSTKSSGQSGA